MGAHRKSSPWLPPKWVKKNAQKKQRNNEKKQTKGGACKSKGPIWVLRTANILIELYSLSSIHIICSILYLKQ